MCFAPTGLYHQRRGIGIYVKQMDIDRSQHDNSMDMSHTTIPLAPQTAE
jgi:hypothetical protein